MGDVLVGADDSIAGVVDHRVDLAQLLLDRSEGSFEGGRVGHISCKGKGAGVRSCCSFQLAGGPTYQSNLGMKLSSKKSYGRKGSTNMFGTLKPSRTHRFAHEMPNPGPAPITTHTRPTMVGWKPPNDLSFGKAADARGGEVGSTLCTREMGSRCKEYELQPNRTLQWWHIIVVYHAKDQGTFISSFVKRQIIQSVIEKVHWNLNNKMEWKEEIYKIYLDFMKRWNCFQIYQFSTHGRQSSSWVQLFLGCWATCQ